MRKIIDRYVDVAFGAPKPGESKQNELKIRQFKNNYLKLFPKNKGLPVLDIGIGKGEMLSCMKNWGYLNYRGIDISRSTVDFCESLGLNCEYTASIPEWLSAHKGGFSLITLLDVLEHIRKEEVIPFLESVRAALDNRDGILIIQVPNLQAPDGYLHRYNDFTHEAGYIENSLREVLLAAGFRDFYFKGFEVLMPAGLLSGDRIKSICRGFHWRCVKFIRAINGNLNPEILSPVFYAVVRAR